MRTCLCTKYGTVGCLLYILHKLSAPRSCLFQQYTSDKLCLIVHADTDRLNGKHLVHLLASLGGLKPVCLEGLTIRGMTTAERLRRV